MKGRKTGGRKAGVPNKAGIGELLPAKAVREANPIPFLSAIVSGDSVKRLNPKSGAVEDITPTIDQSLTAAKILADKLIASARSQPIKFALPVIENADDVVKAFSALLNELAAGRLPPDAGVALAQVLDRKRESYATQVLGRRVAELERRTNGKNA